MPHKDMGNQVKYNRKCPQCNGAKSRYSKLCRKCFFLSIKGDGNHNREYQRRYYQLHKEHYQEYRTRRKQTHKEGMKAYAKQYYETNKIKILERQRLFRLTHKEQAALRSKRYNETHDRTEYGKQYRQMHKVEIAVRDKTHRDSIKLQVLTYYGNDKCSCVMCGYSDIRALSVDHINGGGNIHRRNINQGSGDKFYRWLKTNNLPVGYQTLCMNCQFIKREEKNESH